MIALLGLLMLLSVGATILIQLRYAYANYPKSCRWQFLLVGSSFALGCIMGVMIFGRDHQGGALVVGVLASGVACIVVYRLFFLSDVQHVIPKRMLPPGSDID
jgi:hypothetical protein